ncbi:uncharacterized protein LOC129884034 isoform X2 [Solanum dulcamara]|uniref:uncharacterized protein LOC129884034 isoform X2 n=1 Tax=Solanum dulcamara TaxID=45834 RepID=UPI0024855598|nr:uncharacterized protein LOC129884034 isoform X2 [Solanum dulcamara]
MEKMNQTLEKMKMLVGMDVEDEAAAPQQESSFAFMDDLNRNCTLSTKQRLYGFAICLTTAFLIGPKRQVTMMLDPVRIYATAIYIASTIIALFCALYVRNKLLTLLSIILEFGALIWHSLSYVPFARSMVSKVMMACFDTEF